MPGSTQPKMGEFQAEETAPWGRQRNGEKTGVTGVGLERGRRSWAPKSKALPKEAEERPLRCAIGQLQRRRLEQPLSPWADSALREHAVTSTDVSGCQNCGVGAPQASITHARWRPGGCGTACSAQDSTPTTSDHLTQNVDSARQRHPKSRESSNGSREGGGNQRGYRP